MEGMIGEVMLFGGNFAPATIPAATQDGPNDWTQPEIFRSARV